MAHRTRDSLINERNSVKSDLRSISPKLALYSVLQEKLAELSHQIDVLHEQENTHD